MARSSRSPFATASVAVLLAIVVTMQSLAAACEVDVPAARGDAPRPCSDIVPGTPHCPAQHDSSCPESIGSIDASVSDVYGAWSQWHAPAHPGPAFFLRVDSRGRNVGAARLDDLVPEVRKLSVALLNLRQ